MKHADLISQMTLEEKVAFCSGSDYWHTASIERLGIPSILWSDGPHGIRNSVGTHDKDEPKKKDKKGEGMDALLGGIPAVCYPTAATTACSWDPELIYGMGELLGEECIAEKVSLRRVSLSIQSAGASGSARTSSSASPAVRTARIFCSDAPTGAKTLELLSNTGCST